jgi:hypothetical protein
MLLEGLNQVVGKVEESRTQLECHPTLRGICRMIHSLASQCHGMIKDALDRIVPKYSDSLQVGGIRFTQAHRKLQWAISERKRMLSLRDKLRTASAALTVLVGLATQ